MGEQKCRGRGAGPELMRESRRKGAAVAFTSICVVAFSSRWSSGVRSISRKVSARRDVVGGVLGWPVGLEADIGGTQEVAGAEGNTRGTGAPRSVVAQQTPSSQASNHPLKAGNWFRRWRTLASRARS